MQLLVGRVSGLPVLPSQKPRHNSVCTRLTGRQALAAPVPAAHHAPAFSKQPRRFASPRSVIAFSTPAGTAIGLRAPGQHLEQVINVVSAQPSKPAKPDGLRWVHIQLLIRLYGKLGIGNGLSAPGTQPGPADSLAALQAVEGHQLWDRRDTEHACLLSRMTTPANPCRSMSFTSLAAHLSGMLSACVRLQTSFAASKKTCRAWFCQPWAR
eukprot:GHUV01034937.1.p1 GENE.GHUV01034937.1~~GHUV01034937.1.p1  ORF type:complete len:211 (+),score=25.56 GHUV01034937.1:137-769(+)